MTSALLEAAIQEYQEIIHSSARARQTAIDSMKSHGPRQGQRVRAEVNGGEIIELCAGSVHFSDPHSSVLHQYTARVGQGETLVKYMLLITQGEWFANGNTADRDKTMQAVVEWWGKQFASGKMVAGQQLQPPETATTVVIERGKYTLLDRPLMEAKEAIGGFGILEVADIDEALAIVKTIPTPDGKVEVRPIIERPR